jgi:hypothetical protein
MPRIFIAVATMLSLLAAGQTQAQAHLKQPCPTRAVALKTKQLVIFKARIKNSSGWTEYIACWRSTGVHHVVTGTFDPAVLQITASGPWLVFVRTDTDGRGATSWIAGTRNAKTGVWGPVAVGSGGDGKLAGPVVRRGKRQLRGVVQWAVRVACRHPGNLSAPAHEEIRTAKKTEQRGGGPPPALGSVILAAAPMPDPSAPPFAALSFRSACRLTWTTATGVSTPSEANVCAAAATP